MFRFSCEKNQKKIDNAIQFTKVQMQPTRTTTPMGHRNAHTRTVNRKFLS